MPYMELKGETMWWTNFYKRWCYLCCLWLPKVNAERTGSREENQPEATTERGQAKAEAAEDGSDNALSAAGQADLTVIKGIGPAVKKKLISLGVANVADLAAFDPEDLAAKLSGSSATRVKGWIEAAQDRLPRS